MIEKILINSQIFQKTGLKVYNSIEEYLGEHKTKYLRDKRYIESNKSIDYRAIPIKFTDNLVAWTFLFPNPLFISEYTFKVNTSFYHSSFTRRRPIVNNCVDLNSIKWYYVGNNIINIHFSNTNNEYSNLRYYASNNLLLDTFKKNAYYSSLTTYLTQTELNNTFPKITYNADNFKEAELLGNVYLDKWINA